MARTWEQRGEREINTAADKVERASKCAGKARSGITAPITPSPELAEIVFKDPPPRT